MNKERLSHNQLKVLAFGFSKDEAELIQAAQKNFYLIKADFKFADTVDSLLAALKFGDVEMCMVNYLSEPQILVDVVKYLVEYRSVALVIVLDQNYRNIGELVLDYNIDDCLLTSELDSTHLEKVMSLAYKRRQTEFQLEGIHDRYHRLRERNPDALYRSTPQGVLLECNSIFAQMVGYKNSEELLEQGFNLNRQFYKEPAQRIRILDQLYRKGVVLNFESKIKNSTLKNIWVSETAYAVLDYRGRVREIEGTFQDITAKKEVEEQFHYNSLYDSLTGLPNRYYFIEKIKEELEKENIRPSVLFLIDINDFQMINDSLNRESGNLILAEAALRLKDLVRDSDVLARLGGDEFVILAKSLKPENIEILAEKIHKVFERQFICDEKPFHLSVAIGIIQMLGTENNAEQVLSDVDTALRHAKQLGRSRHSVYVPDMQESLKKRLFLETELRKAVEKNEFKVFYQPILSLETGAISGFEALVRWFHPERGIVSPLDFIPLAEETDLIIPIGEWVLREVCWQTKIWVDAGFSELVGAVNLSVKQFQKTDLKDIVMNLLAETGLSPRNLKLEVTESLAMQNIEQTIVTLTELTNAGVRISIDDFGTGYSSLSYLKKFPIDTLKIDRSFISELASDEIKDSELTKAIIMMAQSLQLEIVAEGVETEKQMMFLKNLNCDYYQGFYFSKPVPAEEFEKLLVRAGV
jgi:diguanylate cyclase (GGDEF)-like protein/PAS domain S-box-containing protein